MEDTIARVSRIFGEIPLEVWEDIVRLEPEWFHMEDIFKKYGFGRFATLMLITGLNDYQLKGKAEEAYWPQLKELLQKSKVPESPQELKEILSPFYQRERFYKAKLDRLDRFLSSKLAQNVWSATPEEVANNFLQIWHELAQTMRQTKEAKTITFAMKCLGIALLMAGEPNFNFEKIPIPIDVRVRNFTKRLGFEAERDDELRSIWNRILEETRKKVPINMIHLDSLIWQIGNLDNEEIAAYFRKLGRETVGQKLIEVLR